MASKLAEALVLDYVELGLALKENDKALRSLDGSSVVELEVVEENGEGVALEIYWDGDHLETLDYDDTDFNSKLLKHLSTALNF